MYIVYIFYDGEEINRIKVKSKADAQECADSYMAISDDYTAFYQRVK